MSNIINALSQGWDVGQQMTDTRNRRTLASLMQQGYGAQGDARRQIVGQAMGVDANAGLAMGKAFQQDDEQRMQEIVRAAKTLAVLPPDQQAAYYQQELPKFRAMGLPLPNEMDQSVRDSVTKIAQAWGDASGGAGLNEFRALTAGLTPEEQENARRIKLGLAPRAVTGAARTLTVDIDGVPTQVNFDPTTKTITPATVNGAPIQGRRKEAEAAAVRAAEANVDLQYKPTIEAATTGAKTAAELSYAPQTAAAAGQKVAAETEAKAAAERNATQAQRAVSGNRTLELLDKAESLIGQSTGSLAGSMYDAAAGAFGESTPGAEAIASLRTLAGQLVSMMPRMEGPQSNADVQMYREMAGDIANPRIPREQRLAALKTIRDLNAKYATPQRRATDRAGQPRRVTNAADYNALPSGATFIAPDGTVRRKK